MALHIRALILNQRNGYSLIPILTFPNINLPENITGRNKKALATFEKINFTKSKKKLEKFYSKKLQSQSILTSISFIQKLTCTTKETFQNLPG